MALMASYDGGDDDYGDVEMMMTMMAMAMAVADCIKFDRLKPKPNFLVGPNSDIGDQIVQSEQKF